MAFVTPPIRNENSFEFITIYYLVVILVNHRLDLGRALIQDMLGDKPGVCASLDAGLILEVLDAAVPGVLGDRTALAVVHGAVASFRLRFLQLNRNLRFFSLLGLGNLCPQPIELLRLKQMKAKGTKGSFDFQP